MSRHLLLPTVRGLVFIAGEGADLLPGLSVPSEGFQVKIEAVSAVEPYCDSALVSRDLCHGFAAKMHAVRRYIGQ